MNRPGCYQPERQLLDGIRTRQTEAPFHGARSSQFGGSSRCNCHGRRFSKRRWQRERGAGAAKSSGPLGDVAEARRRAARVGRRGTAWRQLAGQAGTRSGARPGGNSIKWGWRIVKFSYPAHTSFACSGLQLPEMFFWKDLTIPRWFAKVGAWRATRVDALIENLKSTLLLLARLGCDLRAVFCLWQNACAVLCDCVPSQRADDSVTVPPGTDALRRHRQAVPRTGHNRARLPVLARAGPRCPVPCVPAHRGTGQELPAAAASAAGPRPDRAPGPPGAVRPVHRQRAASAVPRPQRGGPPSRCYPRRSRKPASRWRNRKATAA